MRARWKGYGKSQNLEAPSEENQLEVIDCESLDENFPDAVSPFSHELDMSQHSPLQGGDSNGGQALDDGFAKPSEEEAIPLVDVVSESAQSSAPPEVHTLHFDALSANLAMQRAAISVTNLELFKFPWERGHLKRFFGKDEPLGQKVPRFNPGPRNTMALGLEVSEGTQIKACVRASACSVQEGLYTRVVKKISGSNYIDEREQKRYKAIELWWELLSVDLSASKFGRQVQSEASSDDIRRCGLEIIDAIFGLKSPGTLMKRYYALEAFKRWAESQPSSRWLPFTESAAWTYVRFLKNTNAAPTRSASFMEASRFACHLFGVDGASSVESSLRVKGLAAQLFTKKKPWSPADVLSVEEIRCLHKFLECGENNTVDRILVGHLLHMLYVRARWSDCLSIRNAGMDPEHEFLEMETILHKSAKNADTKTKLLPLVAPCRGITGSNWAKCYLELRKEAEIPLEAVHDSHCISAPDGHGPTGWADRYLTSNEGAEFLRSVLKIGKDSLRRVSTHSLKSTAISWASKFGMTLEEKAVLARHSSAVHGSTNLYSRDLLSPVMRKFQGVIDRINGGTFMPDSSRSGMITPVRMSAPATPAFLFESAPEDGVSHVEKTCDSPVAGMESFCGQMRTSPQLGCEEESRDSAEVGELSESSESDLSSSESDEEAPGQQGDEGAVPDFLAPSSIAGTFFQNNKSWVIHCLKVDGLLRCGRKLSPTYTQVHELHGIRCSRCFDL